MQPTKLEAITYAQKIATLYSLVDAWTELGKPGPAEFLVEGGPLIWGESARYERRPGPRDRYHWIRERAPIGYVLETDSTVIVAFRGTATETEWANNFRFPTRAFDVRDIIPFGVVHDGFADLFESLRRDLDDQLERILLTTSARRLAVVGHSLGGALATLAFASISTRYDLDRFETVGVTFGAPRVGSNSFARAFQTVTAPGTFWRYEIARDPVPKLPPERILSFWNYAHVGEAIRLEVDLGNDRENHVIAGYLAALSRPG